MIDRLLDSVLSQEPVAYSDVEEGEYSALISKFMNLPVNIYTNSYSPASAGTQMSLFICPFLPAHP